MYHTSNFSFSSFDDNANFDSSNFAPCCKLDLNQINTSNIDFTNLLKILPFNISSLQKHFDELTEFLNDIGNSPEIICVTEVRIKDSSQMNINIPFFSNEY